MVKKLILVRHAQATSPNNSIKDIERELTAQGYRDAPRIGRALYEEQQLPDIILSSTARRAQNTAELIAEQLKFERHRIILNDNLYNASVRTLLTEINSVSPETNCLMLIGHNPAISYLAEYLSGQEIGTMEAGGVVLLSLDISTWQEASQGNAVFLKYQTPHNL